ncbi:MAG: PD40 domain-containing protein [Actinobacteria bacterium]|nr:PD40 domain-containing protein [Actinomycetota bacterium]
MGRGPDRAWLRLAGPALVALVTIGAAVLVFSAFEPLKPGRDESTIVGCDGSAAGGLGSVAYVRDGALHIVDVATCRDRVLADRGASPPVRWSPDGRWIAFGSLSVIPATGGRVLHPFGEGASRLGWGSWQWSPTEDVLAVPTKTRGVLLGGPGGASRRLLPRGWGLGGLAFDPSGERLAVTGPGQRLVVVDVATGDRRQIYRTPEGELAPPVVARWSPDGRWVLFWSYTEASASLAADGLPLMAVPAEGGQAVTVADVTLVYRDFLAACGSELVIAAGGDRYANVGKDLVSVNPARWGSVPLSDDAGRSFIWPACSPDGRWIAATGASDREPPRFGTDPRSIWLFATDGSTTVRLTDARDVADELPRWSADGRFVLFVRRGLTWKARGSLYLAEVDPATGRAVSIAGPIAEVGPGAGYYGHSGWADRTDWYRPA